jgi:capsular exopolysaccharide synthesis family protein
MEDPTVRIVDPAVVPDRPVLPVPAINLALSLLLGSLMGIGVTLGRELTDRRVRTRADALLASGLPVVGAVPRAERSRRKLLSGQKHRRLRKTLGLTRPAEPYAAAAAARIRSLLVNKQEASGAYVESWHQLHANLVLAQEHQPKVLVFTSSLPGEGKTLSAVNFSLTLAMRGLRVLLIDADLRCGLVNEVFRCESQPGFIELLTRSVRFEDAARPVHLDTGTLVILPAGIPRPHQKYGLVVERVREVLDELAPQFDVILIDSPPVNLLADAALLGSAADGVVLVVRVGHTRIEALRYAMDQLAAARAPVIGTLLNDIDLRRHTEDDDSYRYLTEVESYYAGRA